MQVFGLFTSSRHVSAEAEAIRRTQAVIEFEPSGTIRDANALFLQAVGYTLDEIRGQHHAMFVEPDERAGEAYRQFWTRLAAGEPLQAQFLRVAKGGRRLWLQATYTPILDRAGRVTKVIKFATDITAHKEMIANLEGQIAAINTSQAVIEFDLSGTILHANPNFLAVTGYALDEIVGRHHSLFVDEATRSSQAYRQFWEKLGRGEYDEGQYLRIGKGGKTIWIQASYNPILDAMGKPWKVVKYASDITAAKAEGDLRGAVAQTRRVVQAAMEQDLTQRISTDGLGGDVLALCGGVNDLIESFAQVASSVVSGMRDIDTASREISTGADDLSKRTEEQASSLEETAATTEELAASVKASAQASQQAAGIAAEAMRAAQSGGEIAGQAVDAMARIETASQKISDIIRVIDDIAFQTNLLALNAAVEAARAGDAGKGFAVVASEVRTLAQRSAEAAKDISALISSSKTEVGEGVKLVRRAGESLTAILDASRKVADTIADISTAAGEQANGIDEMSQAVAHLDEMTQANAALSEQSAASSISLARRVEQLNQLVIGFRTSAEDGRAMPALPSAPASQAVHRRAAPRPAAAARTADKPAAATASEPQRLRELAEAAFAQSKTPPAPARKVANGRADAGWEEF